MFGVYLKGSKEVVELYQEAFDAKLVSECRNEDGSYMHAELDVFGQILAISEALPEAGDRVAGTTMQFNLHFGKGNEEIVQKAYDVLKNGALIHTPLAERFFSPLMFGLIDKFGMNWLCLFNGVSYRVSNCRLQEQDGFPA